MEDLSKEISVVLGLIGVTTLRGAEKSIIVTLFVVLTGCNA